jgi:hypothetical protein
MPIFVRSDRHTLGAFLAQPKIFTIAKFTLSKCCLWRGRHRHFHPLWRLEEEEPPSAEIAEQSTARRVCALCDHENVSEPLYQLRRRTQTSLPSHFYQVSRNDDDSSQSGARSPLAELCFHSWAKWIRCLIPRSKMRFIRMHQGDLNRAFQISALR